MAFININLPSKPTMIKFRKLNDFPTQVIQHEISDVFELCQEIDDPNAYLEMVNKAWLTALDRMAPEKRVQEKRLEENPLVQCRSPKTKAA